MEFGLRSNYKKKEVWLDGPHLA